MSEENMGDQKPAEVVEFGKQKSMQNLLRGPKGNKHAFKHGVYEAFTDQDQADRKAYEQGLTADLGDKPSTAQYSIIRRASWLEIKLRKNEAGGGIQNEHVLSWINSQRLLLCALGLERKQRPGPSLQDYLKAKEEAKAGTDPNAGGAV